MPDQPSPTQFVEAWRQIIIGDTKSWVLFRRGTCVILMQPDVDLRTQAEELLRVWGPVHAGSPAGDFGTYVAPDELPPGGKTDSVAIGLLGRSKRDQDSSELQIIHVEDKRSGA